MRRTVVVRVAIGTAAIGIAGLSAASGLAALEGGSVRVVQRVRAAFPVFTRLEADCPRGYQLTGGGARARGTGSILNTSIPNSAGTGWISVGHRPGHDSQGLHVFAVCASPPEQGAVARVVRRLRSSYRNFTRLEADCRAGYQLTGGGAEALGNASILNASIPNRTHTGWIAVGHQPGHDSVGLHVFAICVRMSDDVLRVRVGRRIRPSYPNFKRVEADCPAGYQLTGGGAEALGNASILNASIPNRTHTGWIAIGHQPGYNSVGLHVFAMCAATSESR